VRRRISIEVAAVTVALGTTACFYSVGAVRDGSVDTNADTTNADAPNGMPFCASLTPKPLLCADFDDSLTAGWESVTTPSSSLVAELTSDSYTSPPQAARFGVRSIPMTGYTDSQAHVTFPLTITETHTAFDLELESLAPGEEVNVAYIGHLELHITGVDAVSTSARLVEDAMPVGIERTWSHSPTIGSWVHIVVDATSVPALCTIRLKDATGMTYTVVAKAALATGASVGGAELSIGAAFVPTPTAGVSLLVDNIVYDAK